MVKGQALKMAVAFTIGVLWGHTGHDVGWGHILLEFAIDIPCVYWILRVPFRDIEVAGNQWARERKNDALNERMKRAREKRDDG